MGCIPRRCTIAAVAFRRALVGSLLAALVAACGDDAVGTSASGTGTGTAGSSTTDILPGTISADDTVGTTAGTVAGTGTGSDTSVDPDTTGTGTSGTDTDTGEPVDPGHADAAFVNAGTHETQSPGYRLLFTFGQSTQNQNGMTSPGYRLRGGLVPATQ